MILSDGSVVPYGLLVWSTGVGPSDFVKSTDLPKSPGGRYNLLTFYAKNTSSIALVIISKPNGACFLGSF